MRIGQQNYYSAAVGIISLASLVSFAPPMQAEEGISPLIQEKHLESTQLREISSASTSSMVEAPSEEEGTSPKWFQENLNGTQSTHALAIDEQAQLTPLIALQNEADTLNAPVNVPVAQINSEPSDGRHSSSAITSKNDLPLPTSHNRASILGSVLEISGSQNSTTTPVDKRDWPSPVEDNQIYSFVLFDQFEYRNSQGGSFDWEGLGWVGGDFNRLWVKTRGNVRFRGGSGNIEAQVLYGRLISSFFDFQVGVRYDRVFGSNSNRGRAFGVIGIQGIAPYFFDVDASLFISERGDVSARFSTLYNWRLTQRLVLQPSFEVNVAAQQVQEFGVGSGFNDIDLGLRLRYEFTRGFAPYVGISWTRLLGRSADFARQGGESIDNLTFVTGIRLLF